MKLMNIQNIHVNANWEKKSLRGWCSVHTAEENSYWMRKCLSISNAAERYGKKQTVPPLVDLFPAMLWVPP